jgi:diguanylate cyclase (GGDEF)-like protein/PAS domain S-box-containing protein
LIVSTELELIKTTQITLDEQLIKASDENKRLRIQFDSTAKQVRELNEFIRIMLNQSPFGICIIQDNQFIYTNKAFSELVDFSPRQLRNMDSRGIVFEEDREHVQKNVRAMLKGEEQSFFMFRVMTSEDKIKWILGSVTPLHMNEKRAILGNFVDLTEGRVMQLAYNDPLTGLANRKLIMDRLEQAIVSAKRRSAHLALLFLDLDSFKDVNDAYGHKAGDQLLTEIANGLREVVRRENDTIARIGGDEFLILLTDIAQRSTIETMIGNLFDKFAKPLPIGPTSIKVKVNFSIGIALFPEHGESADALIHHADSAMYKVKKAQGKNHYSFFES